MVDQALQTRARLDPEKAVGGTPFISAGEDELAALETPSRTVGELWARLSQTPSDADLAKREVATVLAEHVNPEGRARIIDALRTSEPVHFQVEGNRVSAFEALKPYLDEEDVCSVFVEELQVHPENSRACEMAFEAVKAIDLSKFPAIERICLKSVRDRLEQLTSSDEGLNQIDLMTIALLRNCTPRERDGMLSEMALGTYRSGGSSGIAVLSALVQIGGASAVKLLSNIANERILNCELKRGQGDGLLTCGGLIGLGAGCWAGWSLAAAIMQHWTAPFGLPIIAGVLAGVGTLAGSFFGGFACFYQLALLKAGGKGVNSRMAATASGLLALGSGTLTTEIVHEYVSSVCDEKADQRTREAAAEKLAQTEIKSGRDMRQLLEGCRSDDVLMRQCCARALSGSLRPEVLEIIEPLRRDPDPAVRVLVTKALSGYRRGMEE